MGKISHRGHRGLSGRELKVQSALVETSEDKSGKCKVVVSLCDGFAIIEA